jgi:hypothetical protein
MPVKQGAELLARVAAGTDDRDLPERRISLGGWKYTSKPDEERNGRKAGIRI